jgi:hypothetical protein
MEYEAGSVKNSIDARHYATLLCADRILHKRGGRPVNSFQVEVGWLYLDADPAIWPALDSIKRVMEIDETIDNPLDVLLRAGVAMVNEEERP